MDSDVRTLVRKLRKQGFEVTGGGRRHYKVRNAQGVTIVMGTTPSATGVREAIRQLRKIGFEP